MEQFDVPDEMKVSINYFNADLPASVKIFKPLVFKKGDSFCVVLGPDEEERICGYGKSPNEALMNWDKDLQKRLMNDDEAEVVKFIVHKLKWFKFNAIYPYITHN